MYLRRKRRTHRRASDPSWTYMGCCGRHDWYLRPNPELGYLDWGGMIGGAATSVGNVISSPAFQSMLQSGIKIAGDIGVRAIQTGNVSVSPENLIGAATSIGSNVVLPNIDSNLTGLLSPKMMETAKLLGKVGVQVGSKFMSLLAPLPKAQQTAVAQQVTPKQIAYVERTGKMDPALLALLAAQAQKATPNITIQMPSAKAVKAPVPTGLFYPGSEKKEEDGLPPWAIPAGLAGVLIVVVVAMRRTS